MSISDDDRTEAGPRGLRRNRIAVGAAAAAVVLGGGAYLITSQVTDRPDAQVARDSGVLTPVAPPAGGAMPATSAPASPAPSPTVPSSAGPSKPAATPKAARTSKPADPAEVKKQITAAREKAAKDGYPLQRPLTAATAPMHDASSYAEESRNLPGGGTMRIMTAKYNLSGQHEMLWAADNGRKVGDARCTQNFRFSPTGKAAVRPTMLLCWRTTDQRSVVVLTVAKSPSTADSTGVIDKQWAKLG